ncbi:MAG: MBL fold metallo-hydrolase [Desulfurococcaceae archaeon]
MPRALIVRSVRISTRGYTGALLEYRGVKLCIDPGEELDDCTYVLCTHNHAKHCGDSVKTLPEDRLISPFAGRIVRPNDLLDLGNIRVVAVEAYNEPELYEGTPPHPRGLGVGFLLSFRDGLSVYYVGDSNLVPEVAEAAEKADVLLVPIGGGCVMTPEEAVELVSSARPAVTIPVHYASLRDYYRFRDMSQPYTQIVLLRRS